MVARWRGVRNGPAYLLLGLALGRVFDPASIRWWSAW